MSIYSLLEVQRVEYSCTDYHLIEIRDDITRFSEQGEVIIERVLSTCAKV